METRTVISLKTPLGAPLRVLKQTFPAHRGKPARRVSIVTGLHGDELEGLYICHKLLHSLRTLRAARPEAFTGEVSVYPAANPQAVNSGSRLWPYYALDLNRTLGHRGTPSVPTETAHALFADLKAHSDLVVDLHASNLHLLELPQVRIIENFAKKLVPLAMLTQTDLIWIHPMASLFESTLGYNLNRCKIPTLVIETGICLRVHPEFGDRVHRGLLNLLHRTGVLDTLPDEAVDGTEPRVVHPKQVAVSSATHSGLFVSLLRPGTTVVRGQPVGRILDPVGGTVLEEVTAPGSGLLFTLREHPLTYSGALLARVALDREPEP